MRALGATICALFLVTSSASAGRVVPTPIGLGPRFHPSASNASTERGAPIGSLTCARSDARRVGVHLEIFAHGRVVVVPAGIGMAPPLHRNGAYVASGRCSYPARTREPTGVIELARYTQLTLGDFFGVWQKPLGPRRLLGFRTDSDHPVRAYVDGRPYLGSPASIRLRRHAEIVLEIGRHIAPHVSYAFGRSL
jgi:hypothetical protein